LKAFDVLALGEGMVEFNQTRAGQASYLQGFGGDTSNAVIAAARAGAKTAYLTRVGDDWCGQRLLELWRREGVDVSGVELADDAPTGIYFVTHGPQGHEFGYQRKGSAASRMTPAWLPCTVLSLTNYFHTSGISLAISATARETALEAMRYARAHGAQVSLDSNLRLKLWTLEQARASITDAIGLCDVFLPSIDDVSALFGLSDPQAIVGRCHALGARQVVLKLGAAGCLVSDGAHCQPLAAHTVQVVDATGAGDCFAGNLLARLCAGDALFEAARWANAAAALAVQGFGAVAPLPFAQAVRTALASHARAA
jgi:2-dehydro-3-deoxygluconokinase